MDQLRLRLLGSTSVVLPGEELKDQLPAKALALLFYLAVAGEAQNRDTLASLLWSDFPEHRARGNLRDTLAQLRRTALAPYLRIERRAVSINDSAAYWLDTAEFQRSAKKTSDPAALETAAALYQGEFLAGFAVPKAALFEEWVAVQRQHMQQTAVETLGRLVDYSLDAGSYEPGIVHAQHLLALDPWREETHRKLMLLLLLNGDHSAALNQYEQCRQVLHEELGVEPSAETQTLYHNIRKQLDDQAPQANAAGDVSGASFAGGPVPHNLPGQVTPFIGRIREQRAIDNVLGHRTGRLITIFGVGGIGKTRLALAIAEQQLQAINRNGEFRFPDGVFLAPLEAVESPEGIVPALCQAIGFQPAEKSLASRPAEEQLLAHLQRKRLLLVIDNFEHLLDGVGLLARINRESPDIHLLVTSRQILGLHGERLYSLEGLLYPQIAEQPAGAAQLLDGYSAPALFVASARRVNAKFQLQDEEVPAMARLCRLVEGLPLAIELAAGWTNVLSLNDIVGEIAQGLPFLESDLRDLPDRHRSMEAVFNVSWRRLTAKEQAIFARLCVFRGGFTRQAAMQVTGISLRELAALSNKALVQYDKKLDRYQIHRLLNQFGAHKLAGDPAAEQQAHEHHCTYYCSALRAWDSRLKGAGQLEALAELDKDSANVQAAWTYAAANGNVAELDCAVDGLSRFNLWRRRLNVAETAVRMAEEALNDHLSALETVDGSAEIRRLLARVQTWRSIFVERGKANELVEQALEMINSPQLAGCDTRRERAFAMQRAGDLAFDGDIQKARYFYRQSLALYHDLDDNWRTSKLLTALGWAAAHNGELEEARQLGQEAVVQAGGDCKRTADALWLLGTLALLEGTFDESGRLFGESLDIRQALGDRITDIAAGPLDLGMTLTWIGRFAEADAVREEALALYEAQGHPEQIALAHARLATSKLHIGDFEATERHARIGLQLCREQGEHRGAALSLWLLAGLLIITGEIEEAEPLALDCLALYRGIEGAGETGWALGSLAEVARQKGQLATARHYIYESLRQASGPLGMVTFVLSLIIYVNVLLDEGRLERAVEIGVMLDSLPVCGNSMATQSYYAKPVAQIMAGLSPEAAARSKTRGQARDLQQTAEEVMAELELREMEPVAGV